MVLLSEFGVHIRIVTHYDGVVDNILMFWTCYVDSQADDPDSRCPLIIDTWNFVERAIVDRWISLVADQMSPVCIRVSS